MTRIRTCVAGLAAAGLALSTAPALAALAKGAKAPLFGARGAVAGKPVQVELRSALRKGPVVLYFFPAAFTPGCNIEAHAFAEAMADFRKAGATVIGVTGGNTDQLAAFSAEKCAGQFAVAAATPAIVAAYDVALPAAGEARRGWSDRTTYVIGRDGRIAAVLANLKPDEHVAKSLAAVRALSAAK